jgi:hypothetical protein
MSCPPLPAHLANALQSFSSPHTILAFLSIIPLTLLTLLPLPLPPIRRISPHICTPLSALSFILLLTTGALGLHLSSSHHLALTIVYALLSLFTCVILLTLHFLLRRRNSYDYHSDDDKVEMLAASPTPRQGSGYSTSSREFGADGQERLTSSRGGVYGGGAMPGPQYLMNMHPGVPVHKW